MNLTVALGNHQNRTTETNKLEGKSMIGVNQSIGISHRNFMNEFDSKNKHYSFNQT